MKKILFQKYEIIRTLGTGGMGEVVLAKDLHLSRLVAMKKTNDLSAVTERELLKKLEHPGLPQIYDFFEEPDGWYLVMEYVEGISLKQYLEKHGKVPYGQAAKWILKLIEILKYLHDQCPSIIYRDLKPANIMIRQDGEIKLIDLGAALHSDLGQLLGQEGNVGTPGYCPREAWMGETAGKTYDIYGVGAVFHEMLTGVNPTKPPFIRLPVREYDRSIPLGLEHIIKTCTAEKPTGRYQSMEQLGKAILHYKKIGRGGEVIRAMKRLLVGFPILIGVLALLLPLLKGIPQTNFPRPFLDLPMFCFGIALLLQIILFESGSKKVMQYQEKSIWLTQKKHTGLLSALLILFCLTGFELMGQFPSGTAYAGVVEKKLWVEVRGEDNRKLLLKNDAVYETKDRIRLEVPTKDFPEGELALQLVAVSKAGEIYTSRTFHVLATDTH